MTFGQPLAPGALTAIRAALEVAGVEFIAENGGGAGTLFDPAPPARRCQPPRQTTVTISADAIAAVMAGRTDGKRVIAEAIRVARPEVRNVAVNVGGFRWTDPRSGAPCDVHYPCLGP